MTKTLQRFAGMFLAILAFAVTGCALAIGFSSSQDNTIVVQRHTTAALTEWVVDNAHTKLSDDKAKNIVEMTYWYAQEHSIDPLLVLSIIHNESGFREKAVSSHGAKGLMQVMSRYHQDKLKGRNPFEGKVSIEVGTKIINDCLVKAKNVTTKALNCYSGGGGVKYQAKIAKSHKKMRNHLVEYQFLKQLPVYSTNSFQQPRQLMQQTAVMIAGFN